MESRLQPPPATGVAPVAPARPDGARLRQIDIFRLLICFCVLARHAAVAQYAVYVQANLVDRPVVGAFTFMGHFSRNAFFFVSALVLVHAYAPRLDADGQLPSAGAARRRRLKLIGVPFLLWSVVYLLLGQVYAWISPSLTEAPARLWPEFIHRFPELLVRALLTGDAAYHLYFLVVTLQFTLVFPLFLRLLHRTRGRHGHLLAGSFVVQLVTMRCYADLGMPGGLWKSIVGDSSLVAYQFFLVAGGVAALNLEQVHTWVKRHWVLVLTAFPPATAGLLWTYQARLGRLDPLAAADAMHPMVLVFAAAALGPLYLAAEWLSRVRVPWVRTALDRGGQLSFGIYLAHPLVLLLIFLAWLPLGWSAPAAWQSVPAVLLTLAGTVALCLLAHRSRFSLPLIGRPRRTPPVTATTGD